MRKLLSIASSLLLFQCVIAQNMHQGPFYFPVLYKGEVRSNLMGGLATGTDYLGYGTIGVGLDTEKAKMWKGGSFYIEGATTHGGCPSKDYVGDAQVVSNIEAGNHIYLQRLHFAQEVGHFFTKIGLLDLNDDFAICESATLFHNSSFGIHSVISYNFDAPIFPVTGLGCMAGYAINDHWQVKAGIYDGGPIQFEDGNPYNVNWELNINKGYLVTTEVSFSYAHGKYSLNGYYHTAGERRGLSLSVDQNVLDTELHKLNLFLYFAHGDKRREKILDNNINAGLRLDGVFSPKMRDSMGLGCTSACFLDGYVETTLEFIYSYKIGSWFAIEPDIQYVINPLCGVFDKTYKNAFVAGLRFVIDLK